MCFTLLIVILCLAPLALYINLIVRDVITAASPILEKIGVTERELKVWQQSLFGTFVSLFERLYHILLYLCFLLQPGHHSGFRSPFSIQFISDLWKRPKVRFRVRLFLTSSVRLCKMLQKFCPFLAFWNFNKISKEIL